MQLQARLTYYTFELPARRVRVAHLVGSQQAGEANNAIILAARRINKDRVFLSGPGCAATAVWAADSDADVTIWTENYAQAAIIRATFEANHVPKPTLVVNSNYDGIQQADYDLALIHLARGKALQEEQLRLASSAVKPGGRVCFVGAKNEGVKGALAMAMEIFGQAGIVVQRKGFHAGVALVKQMHPIPVPTYETSRIIVDTQTTLLMSLPGTFAPDRLDDGTQALIAAMEIQAGETVLDLGCGTGLAGLAALRRGADVTFCDVNARATSSTCATLEANGFTNEEVHHTFAAEPFAAGQFDCVITNPPFHTGHDRDYALPELFVAEAARVLRAGGRAYFVTISFLKYAPLLSRGFQQSDVVSEDSRFRVWRVVK